MVIVSCLVYCVKGHRKWLLYLVWCTVLKVTENGYSIFCLVYCVKGHRKKKGDALYFHSAQLLFSPFSLQSETTRNLWDDMFHLL
jgi:hypothetical protein